MISGIHIILAAQKYNWMENTTNVYHERREQTKGTLNSESKLFNRRV